MVYETTNGTNRRHLMTRNVRNHTYYSPLVTQPDQPAPTDITLNPVTPEFTKNRFRISKSHTTIPPFPPIGTNPLNQEKLSDKILSLLPSYSPELWTCIQRNTNEPENCLSECLMNQTVPVKIVSDASLNAQKRSAFHWIITTNQIELWNGSGTVPGTQNDAHSG